MPEILQLRQQSPIATGKTRLIFQHPHTPDWLVKVHRVTAPRDHGRGPMAWYRTLEDRFIYMTGFMREFRPYVYSRYGDHGALVNHIVPIIGLADTDLGLGLVVGAARDAQGNLAPTMRRVLKRGEMTTERQRKLNELLDYMLASDLVLGDLNQDNIVLAHDAVAATKGQDPERFMIIDGLGERTVVPIQEWSSLINRRVKRHFVAKVRRKLARYEQSAKEES